MTQFDVDTFAQNLLEEAKRFLERARYESEPIGKQAYLHAALMIGFCAFEGHISAIATDFVRLSSLTPHELGLLSEQKVRLNNGEFEVTESLEMVRLEDRIEFLYCKFSGQRLDKTVAWWAELKSAMKLRNQLAHPKALVVFDEHAVGNALVAIVAGINACYQAIYKRPLPSASSALMSKMTF